MAAVMFHYTDTAGYKGIRSSKEWRFVAAKPPADHPMGAYFTDYDQHTHLLAQRLRIPRSKLEFFLSFQDAGDLRSLPGGRGKHIFYSVSDYLVGEPRQLGHGATGL
jgi:hypothetical protein